MDISSVNETMSNYWNFKGKFDYVDNMSLMESPIPLISIWLSYLLFVLKLGPDYMKKRVAFKLNGLLIAYNTLQVMYSMYLVYLGINLLKPVRYIFLSCAYDENTLLNITTSMHIYFIAKLSELLDTVFFVLRKKQSQVSFLHVYHHTVMLLSTWLTLKFEPSYNTIFLGTVNSFVHVIMYAYYGLSAFPSLAKYLWWKKYITTLQLTQFVLILVHYFGNFIYSDCKPSIILAYTIVFNTVMFIYLFTDFYVKSYVKNKRNVDTARNTTNGRMMKCNSDILNGNDSKYKNGTPNCVNEYTELNNVKKIR